jgi:hypothetical protein
MVRHGSTAAAWRRRGHGPPQAATRHPRHGTRRLRPPAEAPMAACRPGAAQGGALLPPRQHVLHDAHYVPKWVKVSPFVAMVLGFLLAWQFYIRRPDWPAPTGRQPAPAVPVPAEQVVLRRDLRLSFVRPAKWLAASCGSGRWQRDRRVDQRHRHGDHPLADPRAGRAQSGYVFHYAFAMVLGIAALVTWMTLAAGGLSNGKPDLHHHLPAPAVAAAILALFLRGDDAAAQRNAKWVALIATTRPPSSCRCSCLAGFDPQHRVPVRRGIATGSWA